MDQAEGKLAPSVQKPRPRLRLGFVVALMLVMAAGVTTMLFRMRGESGPPPDHARGWWADVGPHCTPLEVDLAMRDRDLQPAQRATCLAVAGKIDRARQILLEMASTERSKAVSMLFTIAHPIADAGDDRSAGPIMKLVVELWPDNYMAVFHAGMADYALGFDEPARAMLERFLTMYEPRDIWRGRAEDALAAIAEHRPLDQREAHFAE